MSNPVEIKASPKNSKSKLDGIVSDLALSEINAVVKSAMHEAGEVLRSGGVPLSVANQRINHKLEELANVLLTDIDGSDGKYDGHITKSVAQTKLKKIREAVEGSSFEKLGEIVFKKAEEEIKALPNSKHNKDGALKSINAKVEKAVADFGKDVDFNHDGFLDVRDAAAVKLKMGLDALAHSKSAIVEGAANFKDIDIMGLFGKGQEASPLYSIPNLGDQWSAPLKHSALPSIIAPDATHEWKSPSVIKKVEPAGKIVEKIIR